jgi:hypothetical protein
MSVSSVNRREWCDVKLYDGLVVGDTAVTSVQVPSRAEESDAVPLKSDRYTAAVYTNLSIRV